MLVILDLNGCILNACTKSHAIIPYNIKTDKYYIYLRPLIFPFLQELHQCGIQYAFWSAKKFDNVHDIVKLLPAAPLFIFTADECIRINNNSNIKPLYKVYNRFPQFNQYNTIIVDDSGEKIQIQDHANYIPIPSYMYDPYETELIGTMQTIKARFNLSV